MTGDAATMTGDAATMTGDAASLHMVSFIQTKSQTQGQHKPQGETMCMLHPCLLCGWLDPWGPRPR